MGEWAGKAVLITGGAGGIGKATARRFLQEGAHVLIGGMDARNLQMAVEELGESGSIVDFIVADVRKVSECEKLVKTAVQKAGRLDVLVNGAGVWVEGNSDEMTEEMWDRTIDTNLKGTFFTCRYAIPELAKTRGCIVNIGSDAGIVGNMCAAIYCASKGGVTLLTKALALELAHRGIRVNAVCPADVYTPMLIKQAEDYAKGDPQRYRAYLDNLLSHYPQGESARFIQPEEVAEAIYFLASPKVTPITGACLSIDFGITAGY